MPGYLFFFLPEPGRWTDVKNVYGVYDVISNNEGASKVTAKEMHRLVMDHITGAQNDIDITGLERQRGRNGEAASQGPAEGRGRHERDDQHEPRDRAGTR
jgi:hypothetical protein